MQINGVFADVTARKSAQAEAERQQELEAERGREPVLAALKD